jgi:hypothetical protein
MTMKPGRRKFALTAHVASSVGWFGAVAGFLALAIAGLADKDPQTVGAAYLAMDLMYRYVIVTLGLASLVTGLVSSLGTEWGLLRHYWILVKLLATIPLTLLLLVHAWPVGDMARMAATRTLSGADLGGLKLQLLAYAGAALLVLLLMTALSVYKPRGRTR